MKRICLLACGGTIACVHTEKGYVPGMSGSDLVAQIPQLAELAEIKVQQVMNIDSSDMTPSDWRTIARAVSKAAEHCDGIVISHGTDTMCYTAAALSFMLANLRVPVVLTGSQMPLVLEASDAPSNLLEACLVAIQGAAGVSIVFNHKIIHGSRAFKMYAKNRDAYVSRNYPYLGRIAEGKVLVEHKAKLMQAPRNLNTSLCEDVFLLKLTPATSPSILTYIAEAGYSGLVLEGFGTGGISNLNRGMEQGIRHLTQDLALPVVMISQCPYDGVNLAVYGIGDQALAAGIIPGNDMTSEVAVVKLMWALGQSRKLEEIAQLIAANHCDELTTF